MSYWDDKKYRRIFEKGDWVKQEDSRLDAEGRCCGKKPLKYKRDGGPHYFCSRCDRSYSLETKYQIPNWAWRFEAPDKYIKTVL